MLALIEDVDFRHRVRGEPADERRPRLRHVAIGLLLIDAGDHQRLRQRLHERAGVLHAAPGARAGLEDQAVVQPRVEAGGHAVPVLRARRRVVGLERLVVARSGSDSRIDVEIRRGGAAAGQIRILRNRQAPLVVVRRLREQVVRHEEVAEPAPVVAHLERHARHQFLLHAGAELPVVRTDAPALQNRGIDRRQVRVGIAEIRTGPRRRRAIVAAGRQVVLGRRIQQVAIHHEVAVAVRPSPVEHARHRPQRGVVGPVVLVVGRGLQVLADVHLDGGLAVAEHVVRAPDAGRDVVVALHAHRFGEADGLRIELRRGRRAVAVGGRPAERAIVPERRPEA